MLDVTERWIRAIFAFVWFAMSLLAATILSPLMWRRPALGHWFARIMAWGCHRLLGIQVKVDRDLMQCPEQPCVYVSNHQSNWDLMTFALAYPANTVVIGKQELLWYPFFGLFFYAAGNILIRRSDRKHSYAGLEEARAAIKDLGRSVWIFPEGTRNHGAPQLLPFKRGAFYLAIAAGVPVVPVVHDRLETYVGIADPGSSGLRALSDEPATETLSRWWEKALRHLPKVGAVIRIRFLDPIPTSGMSIEDAQTLSDQVRERIEAGLTSENRT